MKTVWKFPIRGIENVSLQMPAGAQLLHAALQIGQLCVWALVDPTQKNEDRHLRIAGTGHAITEEIKQYLGTFQVSGGALIFHVFEVKP